MDQAEILRTAHFLLATRGKGALFTAKRSAYSLRRRRLEGTASEWDLIAAAIQKIEASFRQHGPGGAERGR